VRPACDLLDRNFYTDAPDKLWVADLTCVPTWTGFLYLAVVPDAFSRRVVGWAMGANLRTQLVLDALNMAIGQRKPRSVIHHSDQGSQGGFTRNADILLLVQQPVEGFGWCFPTQREAHRSCLWRQHGSL
jgi:transposase InsO family protein